MDLSKIILIVVGVACIGILCVFSWRFENIDSNQEETEQENSTQNSERKDSI